MELLRTCLGVCGCGCLDEEFWAARPAAPRQPTTPAAPTLPRPQQQAYYQQEAQEVLLSAEISQTGSVDGEGGEEQRHQSKVASSSEGGFLQPRR